MKSHTRAVLTTERTLGAGDVIRHGAAAAYRGVAELLGEPHLVRSELAGSRSSDAVKVRVRRPIACFVHITDLHVTDAQSPARFEFVNRYARDPRFRDLLTMHRPHETLNVHAIDALVGTINRVDAGPITGLPPQLVAMTGDAVDNTQRNELENFFALMKGGMVRPDSGGPGYDGVQRMGWPAEYAWHPDGRADGDEFQRLLGYPSRPGLLEEAMRPFQANGSRLPWIACYGNHEQVCQGVGIVTPALAAVMSGSRKAVELPGGIDPDTAVDLFTHSPERFATGRWVEVVPDAGRRPISRSDFAAGFGASTTRYTHDLDQVRFVALDTVCDGGGADGTIDEAQLRWLERSLEEAGDRYVVVLSHHGLDTLSNPYGEQRAGALLDVLLRFSNVVLWVNGHIHANRVTPRAGAQKAGCLWEVTTGSLVDWPCQSRVIEIFESESGEIGIAATMLDHDGSGLASLHRELAGNVPRNGFDSWRPGRPEDRNVLLLLPPRCA